MSTLSFVRPNMNLMSLEPLMLAHNAVAPDQMGSSSNLGESSFSMPLSKKGYKCTDDLMLPLDFEPSSYSVICGRGRKATDAIGNRRLAVIASLFVKRYAAAEKKEDKTLIVSEILEMVRDACPNSQHAFVRHNNGRWFRVQNLQAREKIGTVLRDSLHSKYKSSTKSKLARRKLKKNAMQQMMKEDFLPDSVMSFGFTTGFSTNFSTGFSLDNELSAEEDFENIFA